MKELLTIQTNLCAPKDKQNKFANYAYRSAEDILGAVKPLLKETGCTLVLTDDISLIGDRFYVKATATLTNGAGEKVTATGFAREAEVKKGSDDAQITGACSSYARKYALCGLFAIDDSSRDPDNDDNRDRGTDKNPSKPSVKPVAKPVTAPAAPAKPKPRIEEGNALWKKAIDYCTANNRKAADLKAKYDISDADVAKMQKILDFQNELGV
jgi:hypothetical protein